MPKRASFAGLRNLRFLGSMPRRLSFLLVLLVLLVPFWRPLSLLFRLAIESDRYTHIVFVPFISLCVFYFERKAILSQAHYAPRSGIPSLVFGLILFWFLQQHPSSTDVGSLFRVMPSIVLVWAAGFLLCYGERSLRAAVFPVCFLLLMVPIPVWVLNQVTLFLQKGSADVSYLMFKILGIPVFRQGFRFSLPSVEIEIAEQCSGIRSSLALLITSILAGHLFLRSWWSKGLLVLFTVPVVIFKNSVRIVTISSLGVYVNRAFLYGNLHRRGGLLFALLAVLMLVPALIVLQKAERRLGQDATGAP
jgi:exosortase